MSGIYIHIPFCKQACSYCDFHFSTTFTKYRIELIDAICQEIDQEKSYLSGEEVDTIYFGGGTPSLLNSIEIDQILNSIRNNFTLTNRPEITLEANPDDINTENLENWKRSGINRLSIGLQSFDQADLDWMNRAHTAEESYFAVELALEYGFNLTIDLIYGLPKSSLNKLEKNLEKAVELGPDHISAYCLTVEQNTALQRWVEKGKVQPANEDEQADQFSFLVNYLSEKGYHQYEISNFAKEDAFSRHNSNYWRGVHYLGVGPSAHSFNGNSRRWNVSNNKEYIALVKEQVSHFETENLSKEDQFNEYLMTGLRTIWGVDLRKLKHLKTPDTAFFDQLSEFESQGLIEQNEDLIRLTPNGKLRADGIASALFI